MSSISLEKLDSDYYKAEISLKKEEVEQAEKSAIQKIASTKQIQGFRKGKAPEHLICSKFPEEIKKEASVRLLEISLPKIDEKLDSGVHKIFSITRDKDDCLEIVFDYLPYVKFCKLKELTITDDKPLISESEIDRVISYHQLEAAKRNRKEKSDLTYEKGDLLIIDFEVLQDGLPEGKTYNDEEMVLGENKIDKSLDDHILKHQPNLNEEFRVPIKNPNGEENMLLPLIKGLYKLEYPPIDDNFAHQIQSDIKTLKELKEFISKDLQRKNESLILDYQLDHAVKFYQDKSEAFISEYYLDSEFDSFVKRNQIDIERLDSKIIEEYKDRIKNEIKNFLVLDRLSKMAQENLDDSSNKFLDYTKQNEAPDVYEYLVKILDKQRKKLKLSPFEGEFLKVQFHYYTRTTILNFLRTKGVFKKGALKPIDNIIVTDAPIDSKNMNDEK